MTTVEFNAFIEELKSKGFTHVQTYGGPLPLDEWKPYGLFGGVNDKDGTYEAKRMRFIWIDGTHVRDGEASPPFIAGVWEFLKLPIIQTEQQSDTAPRPY